MNAAVEQVWCANTVESCAGIRPQRRPLVILLQRKLWPQVTQLIPQCGGTAVTLELHRSKLARAV